MYGNRIKDAIYVVPLIYSLVEIADFVFKKVNTSGGRLPLKTVTPELGQTVWVRTGVARVIFLNS